PANAQSLRFQYFVWTTRDATEQRPLFVEVLRAGQPPVLNTLSSSFNQGWQSAVLDMQAFRGQAVQLRFSSDNDDHPNASVRLDAVHFAVETPGWTPANAG